MIIITIIIIVIILITYMNIYKYNNNRYIQNDDNRCVFNWRLSWGSCENRSPQAVLRWTASLLGVLATGATGATGEVQNGEVPRYPFIGPSSNPFSSYNFYSSICSSIHS